MKVSQKLAILIKNLYLSKLYGARRLLSELPDKGWKRGSIASTVCWIESARGVHLSSNHALADRVQRVAVEDLVLSHEDKPKRHRSAREISLETTILRSSVLRIIHRDLQLKCFKQRRALLLSKPISSLISLANKLIIIWWQYCS